MTARDFIENGLIPAYKVAKTETPYLAPLYDSLLAFLEDSRAKWDKPDTGEVDEPAVAENATVQKPLPALPEKYDMAFRDTYLMHQEALTKINQLIDCVAALYEERNKGRA